MSVRDLKGGKRYWVLTGCLIWLIFTLFPLYWVTITSFKSPVDVVGGPTYLPFVDFQPTLAAWRDLFSGTRGAFYSTFWASAIVGISASVIATLIGSMAAYALVRFPFKVRLASGIAFFIVSMGGYLLGREVFGINPATASIIAF